MNKPKRKKLLGYFFVFLGLLILLTPFTPGSILLVIGLDMIWGDKVRWWRRIKERIFKYFKQNRGQKEENQ